MKTKPGLPGNVTLIRPADQIIEEFHITEPLTLEQMYRWLECQTIETLRLDDTNYLVFDEEARIRFMIGKNPNGYFRYHGDEADSPIIHGRGLIVGSNSNGDMVGTTEHIEDTVRRIEFLTPRER